MSGGNWNNVFADNSTQYIRQVRELRDIVTDKNAELVEAYNRIGTVRENRDDWIKKSNKFEAQTGVSHKKIEALTQQIQDMRVLAQKQSKEMRLLKEQKEFHKLHAASMTEAFYAIADEYIDLAEEEIATLAKQARMRAVGNYANANMNEIQKYGLEVSDVLNPETL